MMRPLAVRVLLLSSLVLPPAVCHGATLAEAHAAFVAARIQESRVLFEQVAGDASAPASIRAEAYRGLAAASSASSDGVACIAAYQSAIAMDPAYVGNPGLAAAIATRASLFGAQADWVTSLQSLLETTAPHPRTAVEVLDLLVLAHRMRGEYSQADSISGELRRVNDFMVAGPFPNVGGSGMDERYPPEDGLDLDATYRDLYGRPVRWQRVNCTPTGHLDLDMVMDDTRDAVVYSVTHVEADAPRAVELGLDGTGAFRIWVNNDVVLSEDDVPPATGVVRRDVRAQLREGWNRIVVKAGAETEALGFSLAVLDTMGAPIPLRWDAMPSGADATFRLDEPESTVSAHEPAIAPWLQQWSASADGSPLADRIPCINFLSTLGFEKHAERMAERARQEFPNSAVAAWVFQELLTALGREGEAAALARQAAEMVPELLQTRIAAMAEQMQQGETDEVWDALEEMRRLYPDQLYVKSLHGMLRMTRGDTQGGLAELEESFEARPQDTVSAAMYLLCLREVGPEAEYRRRAEAVAEVRPDDCGLLRLAAAAAFQAKDYDCAIRYLEQAVRTHERPDNVYEEMSVVCQEAERSDDAVHALRSAIRLSPSGLTKLNALGRLLLKEGKRDEGVSCLRRYLELAPWDFSVRELLATLEGEEPALRSLFPPNDLAEIMKADLSWVAADAHAVHLLDAVDLIVHPDGATEARHHVVTKVLTQAGVDIFSKTDVPVSWGGGELEIARTVKADGRELDAEEGLGEIVFPDLSPGDVVEYRYVVKYGPKAGLYEHFWQSHRFEYTSPCVTSRLSILLPKDRTYDSVPHNLDIKPRTERHGPWRLDVWEVRNRQGVAQESDGPPFREYAAWLDVSTVPSWDVIARWYDGVSRGRVRPTDEVRALASRLAEGAPDDSTRIRTAAHFVIENVRSEGGWFVESGHIPRKAGDVLRTRFGDCKDQSGLLISLLREMGIQAQYVLVNDRDETTLRYLPSTRFTHAIVRATTGDGTVFWIDPTEKGMAFPNLPVMLEGAEALVISPERASFVTTPVEPASTNGTESLVEATVDSLGDLSLHGTCIFVGEDASSLRGSARDNPAQQKQLVEQMIAARHPGAVVTESVISAWDQLDQDVTLEFACERAGAASTAGDLLIVPLPWTMGCAPQRMTATETRGHCLVLDSWKGSYRERVILEVPDGYVPMVDPTPVDLACADGRMSVHAEKLDDGRLAFTREFVLDPVRVEPGRYPEFRSFLERVRRAEQEPMVFRKQ